MEKERDPTPVVHPQWVVASLRAGRRLPVSAAGAVATLSATRVTAALRRGCGRGGVWRGGRGASAGSGLLLHHAQPNCVCLHTPHTLGHTNTLTRARASLQVEDYLVLRQGVLPGQRTLRGFAAEAPAPLQAGEIYTELAPRQLEQEEQQQQQQQQQGTTAEQQQEQEGQAASEGAQRQGAAAGSRQHQEAVIAAGRQHSLTALRDPATSVAAEHGSEGGGGGPGYTPEDLLQAQASAEGGGGGWGLLPTSHSPSCPAPSRPRIHPPPTHPLIAGAGRQAARPVRAVAGGAALIR